MDLVEIKEVNEALSEMVALFRVELNSYKGIISKPNIEAGREEMEEYLFHKFPVFAALIDGKYAGYLVCRIDGEIVWGESMYVREEYRRQGVATALYGKAEEIAASFGEDMVYNYVHPNNHKIIRFLKKRGYTVLNLIEVRKPYKGEKLTQTISVGDYDFDY
ncbi:GNAT family N-acetyltransferase [Guggenheimella bovis]